MTDILAELFRSCECGLIRRIVYLTQGALVPDFYPEKLGLADKLYLRTLSMATGASESSIRELWAKEGDPGIMTQMTFEKKRQTTLFSQPLTVDRVYDTLLRIARSEGSGSQELKMRLLADILHDATPVEARYIARIATGRMRLGVAAQTVIDSLALAFSTKAEKQAVERAFNVTSDLGLVGEVLCQKGPEGLDELHVTVGSPLGPCWPSASPPRRRSWSAWGAGRCSSTSTTDCASRPTSPKGRSGCTPAGWRT